MSTDIKLSKAQIYEISQSGGSFGSWLSKLEKKALTNISIPLARDNVLVLVSNLNSNAINKFERKTSGEGSLRAGKWFTLFVSKENMNNIIKIIKSLEDSDVLIDRVTETVKLEIKTGRRISWSFVSTFSCFTSATNNFFGSKRYKWNRSSKSRKRIYE